MKDIVVDNHPKYENTRCFFIVRNDESREVRDYCSCYWCLGFQLSEMHRKLRDEGLEIVGIKLRVIDGHFIAF